MTGPRTPPSTARAGAHDPATVFVRTVAEAVRQSKLAVANDPSPLANPLTAGTHLTGGSYNGSVSVIFATDATSANTASTIVARDASGDFVAGTITAALSGNATTATSATSATTAGTVTTAAQPAITSIGTLTGLTVKGTVAIAGASSGAVSFVAQSAAGSTTYVLPNADGSNNQVLTTDGSGNLSWSVKTGGGGGTISTINGDGSAAQTIAAGAGLTIGNAGAVHTLALDLNYAPTYTTTITAAGFVGPLTGAVTGNATTATTLQTARAINGVNFDGSAPITVTAAAGTLTGTTLNATVVTSSLTTIGTLSGGAVPASLVTAGTFGAGSGGGFYGFSTPSATNDADFGALQIAAGTDGTLGSLDLLTVIHPSATAGLRYVQHVIGDALGFRTYRIDAGLTYIGATSGGGLRVTGTSQFDSAVNVVGDFSVATSKFTVDHATGNTVAAGTIAASNFSGSSSGTNTGDQTTFAWSAVTGTPTTLSGYGITDAYTKTAADARYAAIAGPFPWADVSGTPTTLSGYGITDAYTKTAADARYSPIAGSSSIVTVGTLGAGSIPANLLTGATFGAGTYTFPITITGLIVHCVSQFTGQMTAPANVDASSLPTTAGTTGFLWVDTTGGLNAVRRA